MRASHRIIPALSLMLVFAACGTDAAQTDAVTIFIVRHPEVDQPQPGMLPLSAAGRQRAEVLESTLRGVTSRGEFDHLWHIVLQPGRSTPLAFSELRYGGK